MFLCSGKSISNNLIQFEVTIFLQHVQLKKRHLQTTCKQCAMHFLGQSKTAYLHFQINWSIYLCACLNFASLDKGKTL